MRCIFGGEAEGRGEGRGEGGGRIPIKRRVRKFILGFGENGRRRGDGGNTCARID